MGFDPRIHHRQSIRLPQYDYAAPGAYFVTMSTHRKECLFGEIENGEMKTNELGDIVQEELLKTPIIRKEVELDEWIVMPNHVHFVVSIHDVGAHGMRPDPAMESLEFNIRTRMNQDTVNYQRTISGQGACHAPLRRQTESIGGLVAGLKGAISKRFRLEFGYVDSTWQRNYYDRVIRSERELYNVRRYIRDNPQKWNDDPERSR